MLNISSMELVLVTRNKGKLMAAQSVFDEYNIKLESVEKDYPEIQADSSLEIAKYTALEAATDIGKHTVREDHSLFINALGIPGPFTSFIEKQVPAEILIKIMNTFSDRTGYFEIATVYAKPDGFTKEFVYKVPIEIAEEERGDLQSGWARILILKGESRTFAEYPEEERLHIWSKNYREVAEYLSNG